MNTSNNRSNTSNNNNSNSNQQYTPVCADCGSSSPAWASLNHCVLICSDCCFVHRNLGRQISQIRSLTRGVWHEKQLALVHHLYRIGSNNIWEHALIDGGAASGQGQNGRSGSSSSNKKKPVSNDPIIPKKERFITEKYAQLAFAIRPARDEFTVDDLNKQLWSSVRTGHVETALRLLALGASPNFEDQGNTPMHIAAKNGQELQVELLWIYGADVGRKNLAGQTPADVARTEGHVQLAERLVELQFEISDHFSMFLCGRKPSHRDNQQHFLIPDLLVGSAARRSEDVREGKRQLQHQPGIVLERLVQDVYDEMDRRELNMQWSKSEQAHIAVHQHLAIFLPPNPRLSATRNQLRQKLAKYSSSDFAHLMIDLLKEIRRRHFGLPIAKEQQQEEQAQQRVFSVEYAGDDEADSLGKLRLSSNDQRRSATSANNNKKSAASFDEQQNTSSAAAAISSLDQYLELREKWSDANDKLEQLTGSHGKILKILQQMQKSVEQLQVEQADMRLELSAQQQKSRQQQVASPPPFLMRQEMQGQQEATPPLQQQNSSAAVAVVNPSPAISTTTANASPQIGAVMMSASTLFNRSPQHQQPQKPVQMHNYSTETFPSTKSSSARQPFGGGGGTHFGNTSQQQLHALSSGSVGGGGPLQLTKSSSAVNQQQQQQQKPLKVSVQFPPERHNSFGSALAATAEKLAAEKIAMNPTTPRGGGGGGGGNSGHSSLEKKFSLAANPSSTTSSSSPSGTTSSAYRKNSNHSLSVVKIHRDVCGSAPAPTSLLDELGSSRRSDFPPPPRTTNERGGGGNNGGGQRPEMVQQQQQQQQMKTIFNDEVFPDNLILETELLTNAIKALLSDLQNSSSSTNGAGSQNVNRESNAMYHADSINHHIVRILGVIPDHFMRGGPVQHCAIGMETAMKALSRRCLSRPLNIDDTCQAAYDVAKAAKELLVTVHGQTEQRNSGSDGK